MIQLFLFQKLLVLLDENKSACSAMESSSFTSGKTFKFSSLAMIEILNSFI